MTFKVLHITTDHEITLVDVEDGDLAELQRLVDGDIEMITGIEMTTGRGWSAYINGEGKYEKLPQNVTGEILAREAGWRGSRQDFLVGSIAFVGVPDGAGQDTSVPQFLVDRAEKARTRALAAIAQQQREQG